MASPAQSVSILMLIAAAGLAIIAVFAFQRRTSPGARGFTIVTAGAALWTLVIAVTIWPGEFVPGFVSVTLRNGLICVIVLGWAWLATEYVNRSLVQLRPVPVGLLLIVPTLTVALTITNPYHHLAIAAETPYYVEGGPNISWGPWHFVFIAYAFIVALVPVAYLLRDFQTAHGVHRRQLLFLFAGFGITFGGLTDYLIMGAFVEVPGYIRIAPFTFLVAGGLLLAALFEHELFGIVPVSRRTAIETISDPVIAVDATGRVVDLNPAAGELFDVSTEAAGSGLDELCSAIPPITDAYRNRTKQCEITTTVDGAERHFIMNLEPIEDRHGGHVIVLREITAQKRYEQEVEQQRDNLQIVNQVVRHDIRNNLQLVVAYADMLDDTIETEGADELQQISEAARDAVDITTNARAVTEVMLQTDDDRYQVQLGSVLETEVEDVQASQEHAVVTIDKTVPTVRVLADDMLGSVFRNLLTNAINHNDKEIPEVTVSVAVDNHTVSIRIADNGPGIPDEHKEMIFQEGQQSPDSNGTGLGLYLVETLVDRYNGTVWVEDNEPEGSVFVIELPTVE